MIPRSILSGWGHKVWNSIVQSISARQPVFLGGLTLYSMDSIHRARRKPGARRPWAVERRARKIGGESIRRTCPVSSTLRKSAVHAASECTRQTCAVKHPRWRGFSGPRRDRRRLQHAARLVLQSPCATGWTGGAATRPSSHSTERPMPERYRFGHLSMRLIRNRAVQSSSGASFPPSCQQAFPQSHG